MNEQELKIEKTVAEALQFHYFNVKYQDNKILFVIDLDYFKGDYKKIDVIKWSLNTQYPIHNFEYGNQIFIIILEANDQMIQFLEENES